MSGIAVAGRWGIESSCTHVIVTIIYPRDRWRRTLRSRNGGVATHVFRLDTR